MKYINIEVPPLPYSIVCGNALYRIGDMHKKRTNTGTYDMIFLVRGELFINEDGVEYALSEGETLILYPDKTHYGYAHSQQETFFYWLHFTIPGKYNYSNTFVEYKQKSSSVFKESKYWISINKHNVLSKLDFKEMERIFLRLQTISVDKYQRNTIFHDETLNYIEQQRYFVQVLLMLIPKIDNLRKTNPLAYDIMDYMKKNCHEKIELKTLGQLYNFHPVHIIRCVKKEFNITPNQLLLQIRIEKAKELLVNTNLSISDIGVEVGIYQTSYFIKNFKKIIGSTPYEFRKALGNF